MMLDQQVAAPAMVSPMGPPLYRWPHDLISSLRSTAGALTQETKFQKEWIEQQGETIGILQENSTRQAVKIFALRSQVNDAKQENEANDATLATLRESLIAAQSERAEALRLVSQQTNKAEAAKYDAECWRESNQQIVTERNQLRERVKLLEKQVDTALGQRDAMDAKYNEQADKVTRLSNALKRRNQSLCDAISERDAARAEAARLLGDGRRETLGLEGEVGRRGEVIERQARVLTEYGQEIDKLRAVVAHGAAILTQPTSVLAAAYRLAEHVMEVRRVLADHRSGVTEMSNATQEYNQAFAAYQAARNGAA